VIDRENSLRRVVVKCNVKGRDIGGFVHDAQAQWQRKSSFRPDTSHLGWAIRKRAAGCAPVANCHTDRAVAGLRADLYLLQFAPNTLTIIFNIPIAMVGSTAFS